MKSEQRRIKEMKKCKKCHIDKQEEEFYLFKNTGKRHGSCNKCRWEAVKAYKRKMFGKPASELGISMK